MSVKIFESSPAWPWLSGWPGPSPASCLPLLGWQKGPGVCLAKFGESENCVCSLSVLAKTFRVIN